MDIQLSISNRQIKPAVVKATQLENQTTTMVFTLDNYKYGQVDLRNYKAYAVTSINGDIDMTELTSEVSGSGLILRWILQDYTTREFGALQYQIVFKENIDDEANAAVFYTYKGIIVISEAINADDHITANYPTILKQWLDRINSLSGIAESANIIYIAEGESLDASERLEGRLYYRILKAATGEGHFEDHTGRKLGDFNAKYIPNADLNTMLENGEYICGGTMKNTPIGTTYCMVRVTDTADTNRIIQEIYIPADNNTVRAFMRAGTGSGAAPFGTWTELSTVEYVNAVVNDKDFEIKSLMAMHTHGLTDLFIETFDDPSSLSTVPAGYNQRLRQFDITSSGNLIFTVKRPTTACTQFWINVDYTNISSGSVIPEVSVDNASTWVTLTNDALTTVTSSTNFIVKLTFSGSLTLKNVAFGMK